MVRKLVLGVVALAVLVITPYFVYDRVFQFGADDRVFQFGAEDMRVAIEGTWELTLTPEAGSPRSYTFAIDQVVEQAARGSSTQPAHSSRDRGMIRRAAACGSRTLVRSAAACKDATKMPLRLRVAAAGGAPSIDATGMLAVYGLTFEQAQLELQIDGASVSATISAAGDVLNAWMYQGAARLARVTPRAALTR